VPSLGYNIKKKRINNLITEIFGFNHSICEACESHFNLHEQIKPEPEIIMNIQEIISKFPA
jgi:hypothetical protein